MLRPKPDLDEAVMNELEYLHAYARQNGEAAAWRNAADEIAKLRRYADEAKARLAEVEVEAAKMRNVLQDALPTENPDWWCPHCKCTVPSFDVTYDERHEVCGTHLTAVNADEWRERARAAISSSAGRETAERMKRLEAVARAALGMQERAEFVLFHAKQIGIADELPPTFEQRLAELGAALRALEGGGEG